MLQEELKLVNVGRDPIHSSLDPNSWCLGGDLSSCISNITVFGHVSPSPATSCHLMPPPPDSLACSTADLLVPHAAPPLLCSFKQRKENRGNSQAYGSWALHDAVHFIKPLAGLWGSLFLVHGACAVCYGYLFKPQMHPKVYFTVGIQYNWSRKGLISIWPHNNCPFRNNEERADFFPWWTTSVKLACLGSMLRTKGLWWDTTPSFNQIHFPKKIHVFS